MNEYNLYLIIYNNIYNIKNNISILFFFYFSYNFIKLKTKISFKLTNFYIFCKIMILVIN